MTAVGTPQGKSFLTDWAHKICDLEEIQNFPVPAKEKQQWLNVTVQTHKELEEAVCQALVIETISGASGGGSGHQMAWGAYYDMIVSIAKTTDNVHKRSRKQRQANASDVGNNRRPPRAGRGTAGGRQTGRGNTPYVRPPPNAKYTGPNQVMEKHFQFSTPDWNQLLSTQKDAMFQFRKEKSAAYEAKLAA